MKKIKLHQNGSDKQKAYLQKMINKGFMLKDINLITYEFDKIDMSKNYNLIIEFSDQSTPQLNKIEKSGFGLERMIEKKLFLSKYFITYDYFTGAKIEKTQATAESDEMELRYLNDYNPNIGNLTIALSLIPLVIMLLPTILRLLHKAVPTYLSIFAFISLVCLVVLWVFSFIYQYRIAARIFRLQQKVGAENIPGSNLIPEFTITLKNQKNQPNIELLANLGNWHLVSHKKNNYYYKLASLNSEETIKSETLSALHIDEKDFSLVSWMALGGIGY